MTISELIRRLENIKFRNPNAQVLILEAHSNMDSIGPIRFGEVQNGHVTHVNIDPLTNEMRPLETLVLYGMITAANAGY